MSQNIVLKKGLDLPIKGEAGLYVSRTISPAVVAVQPGEFKGFLPRLLVREGDSVLCGSPVLADKNNPGILVCAPVSGKVKEIVRGDKRKLLAVLIESSDEQEYLDFGKKNPDALSAEEIKEAVLAAGLWPWLIQRPYGILADPCKRPRSIFCSAFDTAPLAADCEFCWSDKLKAVQAGINALSKLSEGGVHVSLDADKRFSSAFGRLENCILHSFKGKHPAGTVGMQIANICPIRKDETVWTISLAGLAAIGELFLSGKVNLRRKVAVCGPMAIEPSYVETVPGTPVSCLAEFVGNTDEPVRYVSGNVLTGKNIGKDGYIGFFDSQLTLLREGNEREILGWIRPLRFRQFSTDHCYFSWLTPWRKYDMDTNTHGGVRAFLMNDSYYSKVLPMDIYPIYLVKACLAGDIEKMEQFGIYEVLPEDLALCEYIDPSKNDLQDIVAKGIDLMLKEMA